MDERTPSRRAKLPVYEPEEIEPIDQKKADKQLDAWIKRNKAALEKSLEKGRAEFRAGKTIVVTSRERFVAQILAKGRKRRAKRGKSS